MNNLEKALFRPRWSDRGGENIDVGTSRLKKSTSFDGDKWNLAGRFEPCLVNLLNPDLQEGGADI